MSSEETFEFDQMTLELQRYLEHRETYDERFQNGEEKEWRAESEALESLLPAGLLALYHRKQREWICRDATAVGEPRVEKSTSGRYELHITRHRAGWQYSKAQVFRDGALLMEIARNYGAFPFLFIEGHPNGNDYLICGEDYQGQTVIELNTGRRRDFLPEAAKRGHGFCWAAYRFDPKSLLVVVDGCIWACPYKFRFFDFSAPMENGWPEIEIEDDQAYSDSKWPEIEGETIRTFTSGEDDEAGPGQEPAGLRTIKTFRRDGGKLRLLSEWISEEEQEDRRKRQEWEKRWKAWVADFKANDPLYLAFNTRVTGDPWLNPEDREGYRKMFDWWCPDFKEQETLWSRRIHKGRRRDYTIDLEWAVQTGPIKLDVFKDGKTEETLFFPHSVDGMNAAFDHAKTLLML